MLYAVIVSHFLTPLLRQAKLDGRTPDENHALKIAPNGLCPLIDLQLLLTIRG